MQDPDPKDRTLTQHKYAMAGPLERLVPVMKGVVHYGPSAFCGEYVAGEQEGDPLTKIGRQLASLIYELALEAHKAVDDAVGWLNVESAPYKVAYEVLERTALCVLFARGLMEDDLPSSVSADDALNRIHREAEVALEALEDRDVFLEKPEGIPSVRESTAVEPPAVATASEEEKTEDIPSRGTPAEPAPKDTRTPIDGPGLCYDIRRELRPLKLLSEQFDPITWDTEGCELSFDLQEAMEGVSLAAGRSLERLEALSPPGCDEIQNEYLATLSTLAAVHLLGRHLGSVGSDYAPLDHFGQFHIPERWYIEAVIHLVTEMHSRTADPEMAPRWERLEMEWEDKRGGVSTDLDEAKEAI